MGVFDQKIYKLLKGQAPVMISAASACSLGVELAALASAAPSSIALTQNSAFFVPFRMPAPGTVNKMWTYNGTNAGGNLDIGIYNEAGTLLVSKGSTAMTGTDALQEFDITDYLLPPGRYYMAVVSDAAAGNSLMSWVLPNAAAGKALGLARMASAFPLPSTATLAVETGTRVLFFGLSLRTLVA